MGIRNYGLSIEHGLGIKHGQWTELYKNSFRRVKLREMDRGLPLLKATENEP